MLGGYKEHFVIHIPSKATSPGECPPNLEASMVLDAVTAVGERV
jgi:hypothetical protein